MTNYEHYKEQIEKITRLGFTFALNKDTEEIVACPGFSCSNCTFNSKHFNGCVKEKFKWADEEYEDEVDWSRMPVDTLILVSNNNVNWHSRYFAEYKDGAVYAWNDGFTSFASENNNRATLWEYAKLAEVE